LRCREFLTPAAQPAGYPGAMPPAPLPVRPPSSSHGSHGAEFGRHRCLYKNHLLSFAPVPLDSGRAQARVAITALGGQATCAQRFIDLEAFDTEAEAADQARAAGIAWVDRTQD
jgi:hypothetical protein